MDFAVSLPDGYNDTNRAFLQAFMARGSLTIDEAKTILANIYTASQGGGERAINAGSTLFKVM